MVIFDLKHLESVHVNDDLEPGDRVRVRIALWGLPHPQVAPAESPIAPLLGHHRLAVGPDVKEHQRRVGNPPRLEAGEHIWMLMQGLVDVVVLIDGEVGTNARPVNP